MQKLTHLNRFSLAQCRNFSAKIPITLIPGDGTGPERIMCVENVVKAAGIPIEWHIHHLSERNPYKSQNLNVVSSSITANKFCLKGPISSVEDENLNVALNMKLRKKLDTYYSQVHFKTLSTNIPAYFKSMDIFLIRESTEGEYSSIEHEASPGIIENIKVVSRHNSERIARRALDFALENGRKKVSVVHKANIMKMTDGLFIECAKNVKNSDKKYDDIEMNFLIVDNCAMQILTNPNQFDVILTSNFYGNIIANILGALVGGPGVVAGKLCSDKVSIHEAGLRKSYSEASGRNIANPTGEILALSNMLTELKMEKEGKLIQRALKEVYDEEKNARTEDLGGSATTSDFMAILLAKIEILFNKKSK